MLRLFFFFFFLNIAAGGDTWGPSSLKLLLQLWWSGCLRTEYIPLVLNDYGICARALELEL